MEAVHGERVCRAVRGTGLPFSYKYIQTTYYTPHYYTHQSTTPHRLHDSLYTNEGVHASFKPQLGTAKREDAAFKKVIFMCRWIHLSGISQP